MGLPTREDGVENRDKVYSQRENERLCPRLQNSPYFCVFKYAWAVKQKVWNEAENRERDWGETLKNTFFLSRLTRPTGVWACEARAVCAHKTLTPRVTDFFTDFEEKNDCFAV